jgi:hypothetical protein
MFSMEFLAGSELRDVVVRVEDRHGEVAHEGRVEAVEALVFKGEPWWRVTVCESVVDLYRVSEWRVTVLAAVVAGEHVRRVHGRREVCGHYGEDCTAAPARAAAVPFAARQAFAALDFLGADVRDAEGAACVFPARPTPYVLDGWLNGLGCAAGRGYLQETFTSGGRADVGEVMSYALHVADVWEKACDASGTAPPVQDGCHAVVEELVESHPDHFAVRVFGEVAAVLDCTGAVVVRAFWCPEEVAQEAGKLCTLAQRVCWPQEFAVSDLGFG